MIFFPFIQLISSVDQHTGWATSDPNAIKNLRPSKKAPLNAPECGDVQSGGYPQMADIHILFRFP